MASHRPSLRISAPSFLLALVLVGGSVAPTIARDATTTHTDLQGTRNVRTISPRPRPDVTVGRDQTATGTDDRATGSQAEIRPTVIDLPVARPVVASRSDGGATRIKLHTTTTTAATAPASYNGRNHVWIPSLGVDRTISFFSCSNSAYPGNRVYRWGCAGSNNIYLFGHAGSVFAPLHDAYVAGRLRQGMAVYYAGDDGAVHRYTVRWWKVTTPDQGAWAYASQSTPSLTLQTCVGASSQYRLIVRLAQAD